MAAETTVLEPTRRRGLRFGNGLYGQALSVLIREKPLGLFGALLVILFIFAAIAAPLITPTGPNAISLDPADRFAAPGFAHIFGSDNLGRDVYARVVYGARVSMTISLVAVSTATVISLLLGIISAFFGGWVDMAVQRFVDAFIAFPGLILILAVVAIFRGSQVPYLPAEGLFRTENFLLMVTIGTLLGVGSSRIIRGSTLVIMNETYVEAARSVGASNVRIMWHYILPNVMAPMITIATLGLGAAILIEASLSFLGLGVPPDVATWGGMLNREARAFMTQAPWLAIFPGLALSLAVFGFNMLGDALRDVLDPRLRG